MSDWADALYQPKGPAIMNIRLVTGRTIQRPYRVRVDIPIPQRNHPVRILVLSQYWVSRAVMGGPHIIAGRNNVRW